MYKHGLNHGIRTYH